MNKNLNDTEKEIYKYLSQGLSNKEIAEILSISLHTVKFLAMSINNKLGVGDEIYSAYFKAHKL